MEDKTMMQCWEDLANAVVLRAAEDYGLVCRALRRNPYSRKNMKQKRSLERFFSSRWFHTLCTLEAEPLLEQIGRGGSHI